MSDNDDFGGYGGDDYNGDGRIDAHEQDADDDDIKYHTNHPQSSFNNKINKKCDKTFRDAPFTFATIIIGFIVFFITAILDMEVAVWVLLSIFPVAYIVDTIANKIRKYRKNNKK